MFAIFKKELRSYFISAIGYVYVAIFLAISALLCCYTTLQSNSYSTSSYFNMMIFVLAILLLTALLPALPLLYQNRLCPVL